MIIGLQQQLKDEGTADLPGEFRTK